MVVLRAIGSFFARIGRWIKNTAWVQPLLIVGGIFAIIFAIPYITQWVQSWFSGNASSSFYAGRKISINGANNKNSDADKLFQYMENPTEEGKNKYGEKFFVIFVQEECPECESIYKGFETLENEWGKGEFSTPEGQEASKYKLYSIYVDSTDTVNNVSRNCFKDYFYNSYDLLFEDMSSTMQECSYAKNKGSSYITELETLCDVDSFATPTLLLYDENGPTVCQLGVSEVLFTISGKDGESGAYPLARTLYDCWYHQDIFSSSYQPK